jgi:hypothetical protein
MLTVIELFEYPNPTPLDYCVWCWLKREGYETKTDVPDESSVRILDAAARISKAKINSDEKHAIFAHELRMCIEVDGRIFENINRNTIYTYTLH